MNYSLLIFFFFFNDTATTEIYTLSLHDALPISSCTGGWRGPRRLARFKRCARNCAIVSGRFPTTRNACSSRSEEHTSELQSRLHLVCRLLLEKKKNKPQRTQLAVQNYV